jgi:hypothetical protein
MEHVRYDLGRLDKASTVVVTLKNQANVQLMTSSDYNNYQAGRRYRYHGGRVTRSPFHIAVPSNDQWVVAIDLGGHSGRIESSVAVVPPPRGFLPLARSAEENVAAQVAVR